MHSPIVLSVVTAVLLTPVGPTGAAETPTRQQVFADAARQYGVPEKVLLGVSYLESRWDTNGGEASTGGGYGPMHLTGATGQALRSDPAGNIRHGAALLRSYQESLHLPVGVGSDPSSWYGAVARYSGADREVAAAAFADEVFATIRAGATRTTDDGEVVTLPATKGLRLPRRSPPPSSVECPAGLSCEWLPAPNGNHDKSDRPMRQRIEYIVIHNTEGDWATTIRLAQDPEYISWHYTLRSADGHIAQHVRTRDVAWHAGNWYVNTKSIGLEHEGFAKEGTWFTEAMYRTSAKLVRYLALRLGIPLDRHHIIGHDNVPGQTPALIRGMHWDPGPYWDWTHYMELLRGPTPEAPRAAGLVTIDPDRATNRPAFTGCSGPCPQRGASSVILRTEPRPDAPLLTDVGLSEKPATVLARPSVEAAGADAPTPSTMRIDDHGSRVSAGQMFAVADRRGDWTAIWYLGQVGWFPSAYARPSNGLVVTPKPGRASVPVYGNANPESEPIVALPYVMPSGQRYAVGIGLVPSEHYRANEGTVVRGTTTYVQIQFGHRIMFVKRSDVDVTSDV